MDIFLLPIALILILIEAIMSGRWKRPYFEYGLPLFSKEIVLNDSGLEVSAIVDTMNKKFKSSGFTTSIYFKDLDDKTIAFREKLFEFALFTYTPLMHGKISLNGRRGNIQIVGLVNWFPLAFCFLWYSALLPNISFERDLMFLLAPILIFVVIYIIQRNRYLKLCDHLAKIKEKKNPTTPCT